MSLIKRQLSSKGSLPGTEHPSICGSISSARPSNVALRLVSIHANQKEMGRSSRGCLYLEGWRKWEVLFPLQSDLDQKNYLALEIYLKNILEIYLFTEYCIF